MCGAFLVSFTVNCSAPPPVASIRASYPSLTHKSTRCSLSLFLCTLVGRKTPALRKNDGIGIPHALGPGSKAFCAPPAAAGGSYRGSIKSVFAATPVPRLLGEDSRRPGRSHLDVSGFSRRRFRRSMEILGGIPSVSSILSPTECIQSTDKSKRGSDMQLKLKSKRGIRNINYFGGVPLIVNRCLSFC